MGLVSVLYHIRRILLCGFVCRVYEVFPGEAVETFENLSKHGNVLSVVSNKGGLFSLDATSDSPNLTHARCEVHHG